MTGRAKALLVAIGLAVALAGCGLKGPLYLPEKSKEVVVRPGPAAASAPATGPGTGAEAPPSPQVPEGGAASEPEVPDDTDSAPPPPPETPTASPPGTDRG